MSEHPSLEDIALFVEGRSPDPSRIEQHIDRCPDCASEVMIGRELRYMPAPEPPGALTAEQQAVKARIIQELLDRKGKFAPAQTPSATQPGATQADGSTSTTARFIGHALGLDMLAELWDRAAPAPEHGDLAFATREAEGSSPKPHLTGVNKWILNVPAWARQKLAAVAFGNPAKEFQLYLHRIPRYAGGDQAELEIWPAPTKADVALTLHFPTREERTFVLEVPYETHEDPADTRESIRSNPCESLTDGAFPLTALICEPMDDWFRVIFRPD